MLALQVELSFYLLVAPTCFLFGFYFFCRHRPFAAASRQHYLYLIALLASFVLIASSFVMPKLMPFTLPYWVADIYPQYWLRSHWQILLGVYLLGVSWCFCYLLLGIHEVKKLTDEADDLSMPKFLFGIEAVTRAHRPFSQQQTGFCHPRLCIKVSKQLNSPITWGWLTPVVILPSLYKNWPRERLQRVMLHELAHVRRNDWFIKLLVQVLCSFMWYLPPIWFIAKKINWYAEVACDDEVVKQLNCRAEYAQDLLDIATNKLDSNFALAFNKDSELYLRIHSVLDGCRNRERYNAFNCGFIAALVLLIALMASTLQASIATRPPLPGASVVNIYPLILPQQFQAKELRPTNLISRDENQKKSTSTSYPYRKPFKPYVQPRYRRSEELVISADPVAFSKDNGLLKKTAGLPKKIVSYPNVTFKGYLPIKMVTPQYPRIALQRQIEGKVITQFDVSEQGAVENIRIIYAQPKKIFNNSVVRALKKFKFMPLQFGGENIKTKNVSETFIFSLSEPATDNKTKIDFIGRTEIANNNSPEPH